MPLGLRRKAVSWTELKKVGECRKRGMRDEKRSEIT